MRDSALAYPMVEELLENGEPEVSIFYRTEKGTLLKIRPDLLGIYSDKPFLLDVKRLTIFKVLGNLLMSLVITYKRNFTV